MMNWHDSWFFFSLHGLIWLDAFNWNGNKMHRNPFYWRTAHSHQPNERRRKPWFLGLNKMYDYEVLENLFTDRLASFIENHNSLTDGQYGFRPNRSTSMALIELIEEIIRCIDKKKYTVVFIDSFKKSICYH